ncbi:chromosome segregation protein SMC [Balneolaceae bacterium ANBcel3]|nr:chromosome segregation protein SMC [Balneolaceae bacterium ANBcel3]
MYLAELELQGFKSFANKTKVTFDNGITAIVGPNGCGKSNIVDALRWVLGEQRPSLLRSAAMSNVIFNGTAGKKALGMAEVSVTIINNRGILPTEFSDLTMTRRLYRSGESEYLLNNKPCRLRDITDLFMDTGMGSNAYSVIELKMVEEILNDKNNDRRKLFEEAAGITKFKERKKQTLKKLSDTRADLQRLEDILVEIRKKTRSLQTQASRAERAQNYKKELDFLDKAVAKEEYNNIKGELNPLLERIASASATREELTRRLQQLEQSEQEAHNELIQKERALNDIRSKADTFKGTVHENKTAIGITEEKIKNEENIISRYEQDIHQAEKDLKTLRTSLSENESRLAEAHEQLSNIQSEKKASFEQLEEKRSRVSHIKEQLDAVAGEHKESSAKINDLQNLRVRLESRAEHSSEQIGRINKEISDNEQKLTSFSEEHAALEGKLYQLEMEADESEKTLALKRQEREELLQEIHRRKDDIRSLQSRYDALKSEYELFKNLSESSDAHPEAVRFLKEHARDFSVMEVSADLFSSEKMDSSVVEAAMGDAANFVVVADEKEAHNAFALLKKHLKGRVGIVPLSLLQSSYPVAPQSLYHSINCSEKFDPLARYLFGEILLADTLEEALSTATSQNLDVITPEGEFVRRTGIIFSGSKQKNAGIRIGLKEKIEKRQTDIELYSGKIEHAEIELEELEATYSKESLEPYQVKARQTQTELQRHQSRLESFNNQAGFYRTAIEDQKKRLEELEQAKNASKEELKSIDPGIQELKDSISEVLRKEVSLKSTLKENEDILQRSQNTYNDIALRCQNAENTVETRKNEEKRIQTEIQSIKDRLKARADRARQSKDAILSLREQIEDFKEALQKALQDEENAQKELQEADEACSRQRGKIHLLEEDIKDTRHKKESNQDLSHNLELAKSRLERDLKEITDHIWETYNLTMDQLSVTLPEHTDVSTARETIFTLKERLKNIGEVNPLAISEYEEEKQRLDHFEQQISDLEKAEHQLKETIQEINQKAQERFNQTFQEIRKNFQTVFHTLFEEDDHCDLLIDESAEDPLEAKIEIVANPRGKRPSVIEQLSGGEKTLTAIALLFAIYLVKPSPFCVMDEVDAPLDDPNILRFTKLLKKFSGHTQFIVITHNKTTMEKSEMMYGVTMPETGISKLVGVRLDEVATT